MKTHKIKIAGYDSYLGGFDGSFTTYCGLNERCSEDLKEERLVGEHDKCTCKKCELAYQKHMEEFLGAKTMKNSAKTK